MRFLMFFLKAFQRARERGDARFARLVRAEKHQPYERRLFLETRETHEDGVRHGARDVVDVLLRQRLVVQEKREVERGIAARVLANARSRVAATRRQAAPRPAPGTRRNVHGPGMTISRRRRGGPGGDARYFVTADHHTFLRAPSRFV